MVMPAGANIISRTPTMTTPPDAGLLLNLLAYAATQHPSGHPPAGVADLDAITDPRFRRLSDAGLAPLLFRATRNHLDSIPADLRDALKAAELTAQVRHGCLRDAANEVVDACEDAGVRVTLLKGISIADQHYPAGHLRAMGDIDILVRADELALAESTLLACGYIRKPDYDVEPGSPHGAPLWHPQRRVWVEVHTALFPEGSGLRSNEFFSPASVAGQSVASSFDGRPVYRLTNELQLAYIASYWIRDLSRNGFEPSFVMPLLDALYLLEATGTTLDWDGLLAHLDNELATASLYIMLDYLSSLGLVQCAAPIVSRLAGRQSLIGAPERRIIFALLNNSLIGEVPPAGTLLVRHPMIAKTMLSALLAKGSHAGKILSLPWKLAFPPGAPGRYGIAYQRARIARLLKSRN
jgi:hypothetical protein